LVQVGIHTTNHASSSSFWLPALHASGLGKDRDLYAYDMDGHGLSDFSGRQNTMADYVEDVEAVLAGLKLSKVVLVGHSMNGVSMNAAELGCLLFTSTSIR
jgi:pimeloyl-ACP methyl ester carboxylesterase